MKRRICSIHLKVKHLILSVKQWRQLHLMDNVLYQGKKCFINNGTRSNDKGERLWDIVEKEWNKDGTRNSYLADDKELKRVLCVFNIKNALLYHYRWWFTCWYKIDLDKMLDN